MALSGGLSPLWSWHHAASLNDSLITATSHGQHCSPPHLADEETELSALPLDGTLRHGQGSRGLALIRSAFAIWILPLLSCVPLGKPHHLSEPQFPKPCSGDIIQRWEMGSHPANGQGPCPPSPRDPHCSPSKDPAHEDLSSVGITDLSYALGAIWVRPCKAGSLQRRRATTQGHTAAEQWRGQGSRRWDVKPEWDAGYSQGGRSV